MTFAFAGFTWPRYLATLPAGALEQRKEARKRPALTGGYFHAPEPNSNHGRGFYLCDAGQPSPRWAWADEIDGARIHHNGWYCDETRDQTIRGIVLRLPHGRYLAGWSMGEGMASAIDPELYTDEAEAARAADGEAERAAEREREYQDEENAREAEREREAELSDED